MKSMLMPTTYVLLISLTLTTLNGCKVAEWFASRPHSAASEPIAQTNPQSSMNAGYLAGGPTLTNIQSAYQPQETATERAIRLSSDNNQLRVAIADRDRQLTELRQRYQSKERLLERVESDLRESIADVEKASKRLESWNNELARLHAQTRNETEASAQAFETLSRQVENLLQQSERTLPPVTAPTRQDESDSKSTGNEAETIFDLPTPTP